MNLDSPYLSTVEAAAYLTLRPSTLERWRCVGGGPEFHKIGSRVLYTKVALDRFAQSCRRSSTSDPGPEAA